MHAVVAVTEYTKEAMRIRALLTGLKRDVLQIGKILTDVHTRLPHGQWLKWLKTEVHFSPDTARRYMKIAEVQGEIPQNAAYRMIDLSALYVLQDKRTPEPAKREITKRAARGERISPKRARAIVAKHGGRPARPAAELGKITPAALRRATQPTLLRWFQLIWQAMTVETKLEAAKQLEAGKSIRPT